MNDNTTQSERTVTTRTVEMGVALLTLAFGAIVIADSLRVGAGWSDGPQSGYFTLRIGIFLAGASVVILVQALRDEAMTENFVARGNLIQVLQVLLPSCVYVFLVAYLGIYVASVIYIGFFMKWLGKYPWRLIAPVSLGTVIVLFLMFEIWFLVPLPKGPLEEMFGY